MNRKISEFEKLKEKYFRDHKIRLKEQKDIQGIKEAGRLAIETLNMVEEQVRPGISTDDINTLVHELTITHGATPAPLNYRGFPKSVCVSINDEICHGIPGPRVIKDGDIVNVDVTPHIERVLCRCEQDFFFWNTWA